MPPPDALLARIRGEYVEMPGLRLTFAQACRLWQVDAATCEAVLGALIAEGFLARTDSGCFVAVSSLGEGSAQAATAHPGTLPGRPVLRRLA